MTLSLFRDVLSANINQTLRLFFLTKCVNQYLCNICYIITDSSLSPLKETCEMEKERPFLVYPVRKPTILREKKELPRDHHRFLFFCLFIINLAALLKIYQSNQYLNKLTVITQNFRSDIDKLAIHHRLLLTKLQQLVRQFNFKDVVKTFNTTSDGT